MRVHTLQPDIYDDDTIQGITYIIIRDGLQYFRKSLIPSAFTGNRMEGKITFPTSILGFLVNQLSIGIKIIVINIPGNWKTRYTLY